MIKKEVIKIYWQLLFLLVIPVLLLVLGFFSLNIRGYILATVVVLTMLLAFKERMSLKELGIRTDNIKQSILPYTLFTLVGTIGLFILSSSLGKNPLSNWWTYSHLQWAFLPISLVQEFVYRAVFQTKLQKVMKPIKAILIVTVLYSGMHILWKDPLILTMTFFGGLAWGYLWYKYPNLYLITLSHAILNFLAIYLGFFPWLITEFFSLK